MNEAFLQNCYLKNWRKKTKITFNKRDTYRLAKALYNVLPEYSIYQCKLLIAKIKWWDYGYFVKLISMFDSQTSQHAELLLEYINDGGKTRHDKENTAEYEEQLEAQSDEMWKNAIPQPDGSVLLGSIEEEDEKYPLLQWSKEEEAISRKEIEQETKELSEILVEWFKQNKDLIPLFVTYLNVWAHTYARYSHLVNGHKYARQIKQTAEDLDNQNWSNLLADFCYFTNWWD